MSLDSMKEIFERMAQEKKPFWEIVLEDDMDARQVTRNQSMAKMLTIWQAMVDAADSYTGQRRSLSGLVGGDGMKMRQYCIRGEAMSGGYVSEVIAEALSMAESNACMRRIVAAPTAGASGVMPAVGRPDANTMVTPCAAAASSAARVRGVTIFSSLVRVPSKSSASTRIFVLLISCSFRAGVLFPADGVEFFGNVFIVQ